MRCPHRASTDRRERRERTELGYRRFRCRGCRCEFNERTGIRCNHLHYPTDRVCLVVLWRVRYDQKPKRRLFELLKSQGVQANQSVIFLTDGGETVRGLPEFLIPESEHWLDWFHITLRLTVMGQMIIGMVSRRGRGHTRRPTSCRRCRVRLCPHVGCGTLAPSTHVLAPRGWHLNTASLHRVNGTQGTRPACSSFALTPL